MFKVERNDSVVALDNLKGEWVLVQFWSSADAASRISCKDYAKLGEKLSDDSLKEKIHFLAVNFDRSERLFHEIVRRDGLDAKSQFFVEGSKANVLIKDYHLDSGMSAYLIDPSGRVVAKNPSEQRLIEIASN
jgi:cytochrome oxidase Cu insertion factor (SCO1/SenC/PrrC family)